MATHKIAELCMVKESYTDREGKKKNKYVCLAEEFQTDDGGTFYLVDSTLNLAAFPRKEGSTKVMVSKFDYDPDKRNGGNSAPQNDAPFDDSEQIPF